MNKSFVINEKGDKIPVNVDTHYMYNKACIIDKGTYLKKLWLLCLYKNTDLDNYEESEFVKEIRFDEKPTKEQIMFYLLDNDIGRYQGYATIEEIYTIDYNCGGEE